MSQGKRTPLYITKLKERHPQWVPLPRFVRIEANPVLKVYREVVVITLLSEGSSLPVIAEATGLSLSHVHRIVERFASTCKTALIKRMSPKTSEPQTAQGESHVAR
jgi:hypothetical protein